VKHVISTTMLLIGLCGCAGLPLGGKVSDRASALRYMGTPSDIHFDAAGHEVWEYAGGRLARGTTLVGFDADGKVEYRRQVLDMRNIDRIVPKQTSAAEVRALLGMPSKVEIFPARDAEVWTYALFDEATRPARVSVEVDHTGLVRELFKYVETPGAATGQGGAHN